MVNNKVKLVPSRGESLPRWGSDCSDNTKSRRFLDIDDEDSGNDIADDSLEQYEM